MGFFYSENGRPKKKPAKSMPTDLMHKMGCQACPRNHDNALLHPKMKPTGAKHDKCRVYILGEAPGENEDKRGRQFIGRSGELIRSCIPRRMDKYTRWNNTIRCRPPNNRDPLPAEVECCRPLQASDIEEHKPEVVVLVGGVPMHWAVPGSGQGIKSWRGRFVPVKFGSHTCWAFPILHPAGVLRQQNKSGRKSEDRKVFERDLRTLFRAVKKGLPKPRIVPEKLTAVGIEFLKHGDQKDLRTLRHKLEAMAKAAVCAVDIETKNLRPYAEDSVILTCSVTTRKHGTFAFPLAWPGFWQSEDLERMAFKALKKFLLNSGRKVCHNTTFEQEWFAEVFGMDVVLNTKWADTMAQAYCLDSRKGMLNLDILVRINFGFDLKALSPNVDRKRIWRSDLYDVLPYNGLDTKWTLELYYALRSQVKQQRLTRAVAERVRAGEALVGAMNVGVPVDERQALRLTRKMERRIKRLMLEAKKTRAWKKFVKQYGRDPNIDSHPDMEKFFGGIMKPPECRTEKGGITTADEVLKSLSPKRYPVAPIIIKLRSLQTIKGTFLDPISKHIFPDGRLHTRYGHLFTSTGRTNSEDPNMQNWVKHGQWKVIRSIVCDTEGNLWVISYDFGQIEARVIAMASQDPAFVQMLWDEYDVHMEWAQRIYDEWKGCLKAFNIKESWNAGGAKLFRQEVKNKFVFPLFFGSQAYSVGNDMRMDSGLADFLADEFWSVFGGIKEWQNEIISKYERRGYVETLTGRRRYAPISYNEQINMPIQGTASDIVVDASKRLQDKGVQFNLNIHDDLTFLMANDEKKIKAVAKEMCRPSFDFVNVPLVVEVEGGPNWYDQKPLAVYASDKDFNFH